MGTSYLLLPLAVAVGMPPAPAPAGVEGVLLLDDFTVVEGRVERFDSLFRVTAGGTSRVIPGTQIVYAGKTRADVYQFMTARADPESAADKVQLATWFAKVGELDRAKAEANAAADLAPRDEAVKAFAEKMAAMKAEAKKPASRPAAATAEAKLIRPPAVPPEAAAAFGARVQPILANLCASCHTAKDHASAFKLERAPEGYANTAAATANLAAVATQLTAGDPASSPLLAFAVTAHGGARTPPLPTRTHPAFRTLEAWAFAAAPPRKAEPVAVVAAAATEPGKLPPLKAEPLVVGAKKSEEKSTAGLRPPLASNPADPFDPAAFHALPKKNER